LSEYEIPISVSSVDRRSTAERDSRDCFGADVVAFLGGGQQRVQHLDRRLEHLDEFEHALVGAAEAAGEAVGVGSFWLKCSSLRMSTLPTSAGDVLVVLVPGSVLATPICSSRDG
jgi:hypothetical protein